MAFSSVTLLPLALAVLACSGPPRTAVAVEVPSNRVDSDAEEKCLDCEAGASHEVKIGARVRDPEHGDLVGTVVELYGEAEARGDETRVAMVNWDDGELSTHVHGQDESFRLVVDAKAAQPAIPVRWRVIGGPGCGDCNGGTGTVRGQRGTKVEVEWDDGGGITMVATGAAGVLPRARPIHVLVVGERVTRGASWSSTRGEDGNGLGTVVSAGTYDGKAAVRWDTGRTGSYAVDDDRQHVVEVAPDAVEVAIPIGWRVLAGPLCSHCPDDDIGDLVAVTGSEPDAAGEVRWSSGTTSVVQLGADGVLPLGPPLPPIALGDRVVRGPDWRWGDQGGGTTGTVLSVPWLEDWVTVHWDDGVRDDYRWGAGGAFDVKRAPKAKPANLAVGARVVGAPSCATCVPGSGKVTKRLGATKVSVTWDNGTVGDIEVGSAGVLPLRADAPAGDPTLQRTYIGIPACDAYQDLVFRWFECSAAAFPMVGDSMKVGIQALQSSWAEMATLPADQRATAATSCRLGAAAYRSNLVVPGCSGGNLAELEP